MVRITLAILLTLAVGLAVGYLMGSAEEGPARNAPARAEIPRTPPAEDPAPQESDPELAEALRKLPVPQYTGGNGRITGYVRDKDGNGVGGVTIRATQRGVASTRRKGDAAPSAGTLEDAVRRAVKSYHWRRQTTVDAITDRNGAYEIKGLADREYSLGAYLEHHVVSAARGASTWKVKPGASVDWTADPVVTVPIDVLLPDGTRPSEAWIQRKQGNSSSSEHWSRQRREIRIPPGSYSLSVSVGGNQEFRAEAVDVSLEAGRTAEPIVFRLVGRPGIRGSVRLRAMEHFSSMNVFALRYSGDQPPTDAQLGTQGKSTWASAHDDYSFRFLDLPPGRYRLGVGARKGTIFSATTVEVADQLVSTELVIDEIDPKHFVVLRVLGPDGEPVEVDNLSTSYETSNSSSSGGGTWARRSDGRYAVFHHDHDYADGGKYGITIKSKKLGEKKVTYKRGETHEIDVHYHAPASLAVTIRGFAGSDHADKVTLDLRKKTGNNRWTSATSSVAPDGDGRAVLGPVEAGEYELVLRIRVGRHHSTPAVIRPATLTAGESSATIAIPPLHSFVVAGKADEQYSLSGDRGSGLYSHQSRTCGKDGKAVFGPLPAGRYTLRRSGGSGEMTVTLPGPEVVFKASEYNALQVTIRDAEGTLAKAGLVDGDLVIAVNGTEFSGAAQMQLLFGGAMAKGDATLTVVRGGRTLELTVNLREVMQGNGGKTGGLVRPTTR